MLTPYTTTTVYRFLQRYRTLRDADPPAADDLSTVARQLVAEQQSNLLLSGMLNLDRASAAMPITDRAHWLVTTLGSILRQSLPFDALPPCIVMDARHIETTSVAIARLLLDCLALALLTTLDDGATLISVALAPDATQHQVQLRIESDRPGLALQPRLCATIRATLNVYGGQIQVQAGANHAADAHEHWLVSITLPFASAYTTLECGG